MTKVEHWKSRAEEARAIAAGMTHQETKATMLAIAVGYDHMAEQAEKYEAALRQLEGPPKPDKN